MHHDILITTFSRSLEALKATLQKGEAFAKERKVADETMLGLRLAPDMFPLVKQVQIACDNAKGAASRLSGKEAPKFEDTERTFAELYARIDKTVAFLKTFAQNDFAGADDRKVKLPYFPADTHFTGKGYFTGYAIPNFYFHVASAYGILRSNGVPVGKADYMGALPLVQD